MKSVRFSDKITFFYENDKISEDLQKARKGGYIQKQADQARMARLLNPILSLEHRKIMYKKIFDMILPE